MCRSPGVRDLSKAERRARHELADELQRRALAAAGTPQAPVLWARVTATRPPPRPKGLAVLEADAVRDAGMRGAMGVWGDF